jgi:hypothetical protein
LRTSKNIYNLTINSTVWFLLAKDYIPSAKTPSYLLKPEYIDSLQALLPKKRILKLEMQRYQRQDEKSFFQKIFSSITNRNSHNSEELKNIYLLEYSKNPRILEVGRYEINSYEVINHGTIRSANQVKSGFPFHFQLNFTQGIIHYYYSIRNIHLITYVYNLL